MLQLESCWRASNLEVWHFHLEHVDLFVKYMNCQLSIFLTSMFLTWGFLRGLEALRSKPLFWNIFSILSYMVKKSEQIPKLSSWKKPQSCKGGTCPFSGGIPPRWHRQTCCKEAQDRLGAQSKLLTSFSLSDLRGFFLAFLLWFFLFFSSFMPFTVATGSWTISEVGAVWLLNDQSEMALELQWELTGLTGSKREFAPAVAYSKELVSTGSNS